SRFLLVVPPPPPSSTRFPYTTLFRSHQLVGVVELDFHGAVGGLVEGLDGRLDHVLAQRRAGIGLQAPGDLLRLLRVDVRRAQGRSEEHTSELQSRENLVCRLLLEKKK